VLPEGSDGVAASSAKDRRADAGLIAAADRIGAILKDRHETVAGESSAGGLISVALLAMAGASAYFMGGAVVYTRESRRELVGQPAAAVAGVNFIRIKSGDGWLALLLARGAKRPFNFTVRLYAPNSHALIGKWNPPPGEE
jgi:hypothetical protein